MNDLLVQIKSVESMVGSMQAIKKSAMDILVAMKVEPTEYEYAFETAKMEKDTKKCRCKKNGKNKIIKKPLMTGELEKSIPVD